MAILNFLLDITILSGDNIPMKCDYFRIIKSEVFSVALISCPECGKQISDSTPTCPHCGYRFSVDTAPISPPSSTEIKPSKSNIPVGVIAVLAGIVVIVFSIPFIGVFGLGIFGIFSGVVLLGLGFSSITGMHDVICPYCKSSGKIAKGAKNYKCPTCKKRSVREDGYLKPVL